MAIEIKELRIKVTVIEPSENSQFTDKITSVKLQEVKNSIVNECILKVLEKIKEKAER
ncbi:DUF5908 family protein [Flavobacterium cellulosilyticum]|uniref:DUF5908 family protein n=1 Tax=Flavobacterium cellulosilyticum TaxID=2541731 RepID=UPI001404FDF9|nr:DUF5908 family protein [Flavobacterium cellulosilyticum]